MSSTTLPQAEAERPARMVKEFVALVESISRTVEFTASVGNDGVTCSVTLPSNKKLYKDARNADEAARSLLAALTEEILGARVVDHWVSEYRLALEKNCTRSGEANMQPNECETAASRTKERQETIGVSTTASLHTAINALALARRTSTAAVARDMLSKGFEDFETRTFTESPRRLLASFESKLATYNEGENMQWMVRVDRRLATRIKLSAKEYGKSASQIVAMCMSDALVRQSAIAAGEVVPTELESAKAIVAKYKGPAARKLAEDIGLGKRGPLLSGVLSGKTAAPRALLRALSLKLKVPMALLSQVFNETFLGSPVPAFKAEDGKPEVRLTQQSWEGAVKSLSLSDEDTSALLEFAD
ncbi:hypothetical protein [Burkholderia sp. A9]|uniref:hypothetical protein n=1 Tax=Burkholderia sp. A9 TaxID=1365108 RepID=UPI001269C45B|nr:hypothetical protein [Burkholderia sp. A9]